MPRIRGTCSACDAVLEVAAAGAFVGATLVVPLCPACANQQVLDQGGVVATFPRELSGALFKLGDEITITPGAVEALGEASQHASEFLIRHVRGDWGKFGQCDQIELTDDERQRGWEATDDTARINKSNLLNGRNRIMSEYQTSWGKRLWVITSLNGAVRTTVLLPEEY
ncbi:MAG: hypothetical protein K2R98_25755 [Gemmataceae bacterium]|nr:hypothetical protein [Gemmataceae bacterium]